ncbi:MAG TPA: pyridoxine 5'-phosphate synthase, partial [Solirubrobacteraceae bacterium]
MNPLVAPEQIVRPHRCALSVNVNKVAHLRNTRHLGIPSVVRAATLCLQAGAQGLTVHPRPDERHIRRSDVPALAKLMEPWRPACELNIEGYPDERLLEIVREVRPEQCTLVPDAPGAFTSEEGWKLDNRDTPLVNAFVADLKKLGCRAILF